MATESTTAPIVLSKEPIEKPVISREDIWLTIGPQDTVHSDGLLTFSIKSRCQKFRLTYHRASIPPHRNPPGEAVRVEIPKSVVVTWERLADQ